MRKRAVAILAILAVAASGATLAQAAKTPAAKAKKSHVIKGTVSIAPLTTSGTPGPPINGSEDFAGATDGTVGGAAQHGAIRGTSTFTAPSFTSSGTIFGPTGSIKFTLTGTGTVAANGDITFSGTGKYTGGTAIYAGAKGTFTFTGKQPKGSAVTTFTTSGSAKY